jgi:hypothetical protein
MGAADHQSAIGQDRLQPVAQVNRVELLGNVLLAPRVADDEQQVVAQLRQQLEPMLKVELSFASRAAELNDEDRRALVAAAVTWFDEFVIDYVKNQDPNERQMWLHGARGMMLGGRRSVSDPRKSIEEGVATVVSTTLSKEKAAAYERENERRTNFFREATIANLVGLSDEKVDLSKEQREKITHLLAGRDQLPQFEVLMMQTDALPAGIDKWIRSELSEPQRSVLGRINKFPDQVFFGGMAMGGNDEVIDDIDLNARTPVAAGETQD